MLKEGALPTLNLPRESASNTMKHRSGIAIEKREKDLLLEEHMLCHKSYKMLINNSRISHHELRALHRQKSRRLRSRNS